MKRNSLWGFLLIVVFIIVILIFCCFYLMSEIGRLNNAINKMATIALGSIEEMPTIIENKDISYVYCIERNNNAKIY